MEDKSKVYLNGLNMIALLIAEEAEKLNIPAEFLGVYFQCYTPCFSDVEPCTFTTHAYPIWRTATPWDEDDTELPQELAHTFGSTFIASEWCYGDDNPFREGSGLSALGKLDVKIARFASSLNTDLEMICDGNRHFFVGVDGQIMDFDY